MSSTRDQEVEAFVLARGPALLRTAHLLTGDRGHAEDLLQQALERMVRHWSRIDQDPEGWVRRTLVNLSTDRWRHRARRPREVGGLVPDRAASVEPTTRVEDRQQLVQALRILTPRQRAVLVLRYFDDLSEAQVAVLLGCSVGTVKSTSSKALARLRTAATTIPSGSCP